MTIKNQYTHSKYGMFMFNLLARWTEFLVKHKWLYYVLSFTWGILMTIASGIVMLACCFASINWQVTFFKYNWVVGIKIGPDYWGGCETGLAFIRDQKSYESINAHEFGHTFQNTLLGPFAIFLCFIPSACRYWYQEIRNRKGLTNKPYDQAWLEDAASRCGEYANKYLKGENK